MNRNARLGVGLGLFALVIGGTISGCKRASEALLAGPSGSVSAVTLAIPQVDTQADNVYRIFVSALDQVGNPLLGFTLGNFSILENGGPGIPLEVGRVQETLYVALVIDRSGSMAGAATTAANTAAVALVNALSAADYLALIEFSSDVNITSGFTNDKNALITLINNGVADGGTAVYDATVEGSNLLLSGAGRRMLVVLTDGEDTASSHTAESAIEAVNDKGHSANMVGLGAFANPTVLEQIASATGGTFALSLTGADLGTIFLAILERFENLTYIRYRRRESGPLTVYLNYGNLTSSVARSLD